MAYKIDVSKIIKGHISTLVDSNTKRAGFRDYFFFLALPSIIAFILIYYGKAIDNDTSNALIGGLSIFVGLSINFLMIVFELSSKDFFKQEKQKKFLIEIIKNISFLTVLTLFIILLLLLTNIEQKVFSIILYSILYFCLINFLMTLLMVIKRIYNLLTGIIEYNIN